MKKLIYGTLFLALGGIVMVGCEKESINPNDVNYTVDSKKAKEKIKNQKSSTTDMENLAQAANVDNITYSNGDYNMTFFDISGTYAVEIISFDDEVLIEYTITDPNSVTTDITIDIVNETIGIEGVGNYTFAQYENYEVGTTENRMKNIMAVITVHHSLEPSSSTSYSDNGTGGVFPSNDAPRWKKFWKNDITSTPCSDGTYDFTNKWERFWIFSGTQTGTLPC